MLRGCLQAFGVLEVAGSGADVFGEAWANEPAVSAHKAPGSGGGCRAEREVWHWLAQKAWQGTKGKVLGHERFSCGHVLNLGLEIVLLLVERWF